MSFMAILHFPPNKLPPLFPRTLISSKHLTINTSSVYFLRPRFDPSKAWPVSMQESVVGNLIVRHALTYREISNQLDLSDTFWSTVTDIGKSYAINSFCEYCNRFSSMNNLELVQNVAGFCSSKFLGFAHPIVYHGGFPDSVIEYGRLSSLLSGWFNGYKTVPLHLPWLLISYVYLYRLLRLVLHLILSMVSRKRLRQGVVGS